MPDRPEDIRRRTIDAYDAHAESYAGWNASLDPLVGHLTRFLDGLPAGARVLDAGCGPGRDAAYLAAQGCRVTGLDLSRGQLLCAVKQNGAAPAVDFVQGDLLRLPFQAGMFGGLWACASLLHLPRELAPDALGELRRVAAPGAPLYLSVKQGKGARWEPAPALQGALRYFAFYAPDEIAALVRAAGFAVEAVAVDGPMWVNVFARAGEA